MGAQVRFLSALAATFFQISAMGDGLPAGIGRTTDAVALGKIRGPSEQMVEHVRAVNPRLRGQIDGSGRRRQSDRVPRIASILLRVGSEPLAYQLRDDVADVDRSRFLRMAINAPFPD
ncbi:hypothetical protein [Bradyrhizobium sp. RT4b]|uniref:hypothetical protein n=1 Tax=Bradyrhizobium sp. RT4b TaxID=3156379 RepID=UPI00339B0F9F